MNCSYCSTESDWMRTSKWHDRTCMVNGNKFCSFIYYELIYLFVCLLISFRWIQQLSPKLWFLFLFLYLCEILALIIYSREWESHWKVSGLLPRAGIKPRSDCTGQVNFALGKVIIEELS